MRFITVGISKTYKQLLVFYKNTSVVKAKLTGWCQEYGVNVVGSQTTAHNMRIIAYFACCVLLQPLSLALKPHSGSGNMLLQQSMTVLKFSRKALQL